MSRILIVDDEPDMRLAVRNVLKLRGYEISEAGDGPSALAMVRESRPDLVLLDIRLPGMDGIEVLDGLKKMDDSLPVVMITGYGHIQSAVDVMKLGASEYLQKPFENAQLVETVKKFVQGGTPAAVRVIPQVRPLPVMETPPAPERRPVPAAAASASQPPSPGPIPPPSKARKTSRRTAAVLALAALLVLSGAMVYRQSKVSAAAYHREYQGAAANISAIVWNGDRLVAGDWLTQAVYVYSAGKEGLKLEETYPLEKTHISGLAVAGDVLYVADSWKKTIESRRLGPGLTPLGSVPMSGKVSALFYDGEYLWTCDSEGNAVMRLTDPELTPTVAFKLPEKPDQIFKTRKYLWTAVSSTGKLYRHNLDDSLSLDAVFTLKTSRPGNPLSAFAWRGSRLWLARDGLPAIAESGAGELVKE